MKLIGVTITIVDAIGREARTVYRGALDAGAHDIAMPTDGLPTGAYFVRIDRDGVPTLLPFVKR